MKRYAVGKNPAAIAAITEKAALSNRNWAMMPPMTAQPSEAKMTEETHHSAPACFTRFSIAEVPGKLASRSSTQGVGLRNSCLRIVPSAVGFFTASCERTAIRRRTALSVSVDRVKRSTTPKQTIKTRRNISDNDIEMLLLRRAQVRRYWAAE